MNKFFSPTAALSACVALALGTNSFGVTSNFTPIAYAGSPYDYQNVSLWTAGVPNAIDDSAIFSANIGSDTATQGTLSINLNAAVTLGNLTIGDANSGAGNGNGFYNLQNGTGGSLTFNATGNPTLQKTAGSGTTDFIPATVNLSKTLSAAPLTGGISISGLVGGAGGILRTALANPAVAGGTLTLTNNANSYTGSTVIEHGTLAATLNGDVLAGANSVFGNSSSAVVIGTATTGTFTNTTTVLNLVAGSDAANYTFSRGIDFSQDNVLTGTPQAVLGSSTVSFNSDGAGSLNTNTLTLSGPLTLGGRLTQITAQRGGMTVNITGNISQVSAGTVNGALRLNSFPPDPSADGRSQGTIRFSNLNRTYAGSNLLLVGRIIVEGSVGALNNPSPIGLGTIDLGQGSGGNIVGGGNFAGVQVSSRDTSPDTNRSVFLESAGSSFARILSPGVGSSTTPITGGYTSAVNVINGFELGGLNTTGLVTFNGAINPASPSLGGLTTNPITVGVNLALQSSGSGTVLINSNIADSTNANSVVRITINQVRNHPSLDGVNNVTGSTSTNQQSTATTGPDGIPDASANQLVGTPRTGTVVLTGANTWEGTTEVLGGRLLVNSGIQGNTVIVAAGATIGGGSTTGLTGIIASGIAGSTMQVSGTVAPGGSVDPLLGAITGTGILSVAKSVNFLTGSTFALELNGTSAGTLHDQLVTGTSANVSITGTSAIALALGYSAGIGDSFTVIDNQSDNMIVGNFANLADDAFFNAGSAILQASYDGGDGNDLVLIVTAIPEPQTWVILLGGLGLLMAIQRSRRCRV